ncbi:MAG: zonular occludens toxin domain-containing protein, partial [Gordonia sp. (in: high G+C Gram-positive bacteria)]|uniref:ATP-binding protein n=1 Tax=Gordonia sp. (in: high G+C Gram-positive bacteria) TaxID=84139 RepID=UPI003BB62623
VLDDLWARRHERIGRLIVIDEAHNLCPPNPTTPLERLLTERIVQIAAEGRKYGLWLLMSTQRPSKVHPNALSQCDNLGLMKMSSPRDLAELGSIFGYAPEELRAQATDFVQGQVLFAGGFAPEAMLVQMGSRLTREGGADVPIELR